MFYQNFLFAQLAVTVTNMNLISSSCTMGEKDQLYIVFVFCCKLKLSWPFVIVVNRKQTAHMSTLLMFITKPPTANDTTLLQSRLQFCKTLRGLNTRTSISDDIMNECIVQFYESWFGYYLRMKLLDVSSFSYTICIWIMLMRFDINAISARYCQPMLT